MCLSVHVIADFQEMAKVKILLLGLLPSSLCHINQTNILLDGDMLYIGFNGLYNSNGKGLNNNNYCSVILRASLPSGKLLPGHVYEGKANSLIK
jgi:hypothetical protein